MKKRINIAVVLLAFFSLSARAQRVTDAVLKNIVKATRMAGDKKPVEKVYLQTDKANYNFGDTIRMKAYLLKGDYVSASAISNILYAELNDESGKCAKRIMMPVSQGLAWADMALDTADIKPGNYTLRAYTTWMRNFGEDYIFKKHITISRYTDHPVLVSTVFKQTASVVEGELQLKQLDGSLLAFKGVELRLMNGKKNLSKDRLTTATDGRLSLNFPLPDNAEPVSIKAKIAGNPEFTIPVKLKRPENTDVQFMPEGGALVAGLPIKLGVKAIDEDGNGTDVKGKLLNSKGEEVATINTLYNGMGNFNFIPRLDETYTAKFEGINKSYALPKVNPSGTTLAISTSGSDSFNVGVAATNDKAGTYYLIGQARGVICYAEPVSPTNGTVNKMVKKDLFPTGIVRFTLLNGNQQPLNERIVFVDHKDELKLSIQPDKAAYQTRDSVSLAVQVTDKDGKPVQGSFVMAVTDASQVNVDSLGGNILSNLLLTSDLKGDVAQPNYYFTGNKAAELDNLMLTQGWVGYDWRDVLSPNTEGVTYQPEKEFVVQGKVTNAFGKPIERSAIGLMGRSPIMVADALTDKNGIFTFRDLWPVDTAIFKLQARNKNNKEFNVGIVMDEPTYPKFNEEKFTGLPWYVNSDTAILNNAGSRIAEQKAMDAYRGSGNVLKEVNVKAKKVIKGSHNLNGPGEADLVLDEKDMLKAGKKTLTELLREKIPGFAEYGFWTPCIACSAKRMSYVLYGKKVSFIFDRLDIDKFYTPEGTPEQVIIQRWAYIKSYLDYYTAEDIVGIELMFSPKYNRAYASSDFKNLTFDSHAFIEITTRTKDGPFMKVTPGTYLYKPLAFTMPKQFYSPKYTAKNKNTAFGTDLRSTVYWEPNIVTDAAGMAKVSFYSADKATNYAIVVEGTDMSGQFGHKKAEIVVRK